MFSLHTCTNTDHILLAALPFLIKVVNYTNMLLL